MLWRSKELPVSKNISELDKKSLIERMTIASQCVYCALQLLANTSGNEPIYHLPHTRSIDTLMGAQASWNLISDANDFSQLVNFAYSKLSFIERILPYAFDGWITNKEWKSIVDYQINMNTTQFILDSYSVRDQLRLREAGPLKGARR